MVKKLVISDLISLRYHHMQATGEADPMCSNYNKSNTIFKYYIYYTETSEIVINRCFLIVFWFRISIS